jgi:signal transduction histidine kinase/GAF domain-containing protein
VTDAARTNTDARLETAIPNGAASLESILRTDELLDRPSRLPDCGKENAALVALIGALADDPETILQTLADKVLDVLQADSAGLSLLTRDGQRFYWAAIAGAWGPHIGGGTPRDFGPCGDVLDRNVPMLFTHWERRYPYLGTAFPLAEEGLLVPFFVNGKSVGTIWAISHDSRRKFDREDLRLLESMGRFASAAYQTVESLVDLKSQIAARERAESELRELTDGLGAQVLLGTEELARRKSELSEARARLAEEKLGLQRSEAFLAEAQRLAHCGSWHLNLRTGKVIWSQELVSILGSDAERTKDSDPLFLQRIHPEDRARVDQIRGTAIRERKDYDIEYRLLLPGGVIKYLHAAGHCLASEPDAEYIGAILDITERKRVEEELRRSEAFLAQAQRLSRTGSFSWRVATDEITWSEQLHRIFELDPQVPVTLASIRARVHPDDVHLVDDVIAWARGGIGDCEYEHRLQMPDGAVKYLHLMVHGIHDEQGRLEYIGAVQDVTQRRLSEQALDKAQTELAHMARVSSLGVLTASIAHEVSQPLAGILNNANTCMRMLAASPANVDGARETVRRTIRDANRASDVVTRLRTLFGKKDAAAEPLDLNQIAEEVIALSLHQMQRNRVVLRTELGDALPRVTGDRIQLQQVILNLLLNASDAMGGVEDRPRTLVVRTAAHDGGGGVHLSVQDAGVGLEPQTLGRLFEAFYTTKSGGMGIGLFVSRSIIERHHGRLWATPNDGPGATFSFTLPRTAEGAAAGSPAFRIRAVTDAEHVMRSL